MISRRGDYPQVKGNFNLIFQRSHLQGRGSKHGSSLNFKNEIKLIRYYIRRLEIGSECRVLYGLYERYGGRCDLEGQPWKPTYGLRTDHSNRQSATSWKLSKKYLCLFMLSQDRGSTLPPRLGQTNLSQKMHGVHDICYSWSAFPTTKTEICKTLRNVRVGIGHVFPTVSHTRSSVLSPRLKQTSICPRLHPLHRFLPGDQYPIQTRDDS